MFIVTTPQLIIDDQAKPSDQQNALHIKPDLTLGEWDFFWSEHDRMVAHYGVISPAQEEALIFKHRLCGWSGPMFAGVPFTRENVNLLDYHNPVVERAIVAAYAAHMQIPPVEDLDPKAPASATKPTKRGSRAGSKSSKASAARSRATTTRK